METSGTMIIAGVTTLFGVALLFLSLFVAGRGGLGKGSEKELPPE